MEESGALARRAVTCNLLTLPGGRDQEVHQFEFCLFHLPCETLIALNPIEFRGDLVVNDLFNIPRNSMRLTVGARCKHAERTAMRFQFLYVEHLQPMRLHDLDRVYQGEIGEVLMVDCVELIEFDQTKQMREFKREDAFRLQQDF